MRKVRVLKNGLTIICESKKTDKVCMGVLVKTGLINETNIENGISHFLEHMAFKGTKTKTAKELSESIESLGGSCNAYTSNDHTFYYVNMLAKDYKTGLQFLSDIIINSTFPEEEIERERKVILQEIARSKDNPGHVFWDRLGETIYEKQLAGRTILGPAKNIKRFTKNDLIAYVKKWYCPNNMIVSVCGNISTRQVIKEVKKLFGNLKSNKLPDLPKNNFVVQDKTFEEIFEQAMVAIVYNGPVWKEKTAVKAMFGAIFDGGMSCRLFQEMREKYGLCYSTDFLSDALKESGYIGVFAGVKEKDIKTALKVMESTINSMKTTISDEEMEKARNILLYKTASIIESCEQTTSYNAINYMYLNKVNNIKKYLKEIKAVKKEDVLNFANTYITKEVSRIIIKHKKVNKSK